jgi:hypothetical protein
LRLVKSSAILVYSVDIVAYADIDVFVAVRRSVEVAVRGNCNPFTVRKGDDLGNFFTDRDIPKADSVVIGTGKNLFAIRAKRYGINPIGMP